MSPPSGDIWYTLDGTAPTTNSTSYTGPILVDRSLRVRARVFSPGRVPGPVSGAGYSQIAPSQQAFSSNLPLLLVDTHGRPIGEGTRAPAYVSVIEPRPGRSGWSSPVTLHLRAGIEIRGSSSTQFPKKSYGLELNAEDGSDRAAGLLDLPPESDWVLYAPYTDKTLVRDVLAYELSNRIGRYAPRTRFVEVFINRSGTVDATDYLGVYVLIEKVKGGGDRVDIPEVESTDVTEPGITGGYILKKDRLDATDARFVTPRGQELGLEWPRARDLTPVQTQWIRSYFSRFESALYGTRYRDPVAGYGPFIDADAFVDHHWLVEVAKNIDGFRLSTFMHKDRGGRLAMGPIWDYNLSFGNANYLAGEDPTGWYYVQLGNDDYPWYRRLFEDPAFAQRHTDRWASLRTGALATDRVLSLVDGYTNQLAEAQDRNFKKWRILGQYVWPNAFIGRTYADEIGFLKQWITARLDWIDSTIVPWPKFDQPSGYYPQGVTIRITAAHPIYYTLDGSDPRTAGGAIASGSLRYVGPVSLAASARLTARARDGSRWSPPTRAAYALTLPDLRITEIMYHPPDPPAGSAREDADFEFLELRNVGFQTLSLDGFTVTGGINYAFPVASGDLWPGENLVLARNPAAFAERYGAGHRVAGPFDGRLNNAGDSLVLTGPLGEPVLSFSYDDGWQPSTDGRGYSLTIRHPLATPALWSRADAWDRSAVAGGTPGWNDVPDTDLQDLSARWITDSGPRRLELQFTAAAGQTYSVQSASRLEGASWQTVTNLPPSDVGGPLTVRVADEPAEGRLFRIVRPRQP
ncbi:MAG: CotH kinase family protein [Verrucomicrobia bacterium]|nr:CotH kinase family protein [Verrucomicrobiota bacterium]